MKVCVNKTPQEVHNLICHKHVDVGVRCLETLLRFSADPVRLVVHDDGTLTSDDVDRLKNGLNNPTIITRQEADQQVGKLLKDHPECLRLREENVLALKLFDGPLLARGDFAYCDSDVLFTRPFRGLFKWPDEEANAIFLKDRFGAYVIKARHILGFDRIKLASKINVGIIFLRRCAYDLDFMEGFIKRLNYRYDHWAYEQTCFSALGREVGCMWYDPAQLNQVYSPDDGAGLVGVHLIGGKGWGWLDGLYGRVGFFSGSQPEEIRTIRAADASARELLRMVWYMSLARDIYCRLYEGYYEKSGLQPKVREIRSLFRV